MLGRSHRLDRAVRLAAVGRAEQGGPASRQAPGRVELVVVDEARVVLQQHGKRHLFLVLAAGGANRLAHAAGFQGDELGKTLVPEQLQVEIAGELEHALERGLQLVAILALPRLDFRHAEQMILAGRNPPLQFEGEIAVLQGHHVAQLMANLVQGGDGMRQKFIDPWQFRADARQAPLPLVLVHFGEGPFEHLQPIAHIALHGLFQVVGEIVAPRAIVQTQRPVRLQQMDRRAEAEGLLAAEHIHAAVDLAEITADDPVEQLVCSRCRQQFIHRLPMQPQPERLGRASQSDDGVADVRGEPLFLVMLLRGEFRISRRCPVEEARQTFEPDGFELLAPGLGHDRHLC